MAREAAPDAVIPPSPPMQRALDLARAVKGRTSPNPAVGAVIVRDGVIIGEGATLSPGLPHAEPVALAQAGEAARGATLYVTLEPCSHYGRTPPCADAIVASGISHVVMATLDPNPQVAGAGRHRLEAAGIITEVGDGQREARAINEDFAFWVTTRRPWVIAKFGASLDGKTATRTGESRWITGNAARAAVHRMRDLVDAIVAGVTTVLRDDPQLITRLDDPEREPRHPWRLILDSDARTPPGARVLDPALPGRTTIVAAQGAAAARLAALEAAGAGIWVLPRTGGRVDLGALVRKLGEEQVTSLLVEGGATVHGAFFDAGLVDYVMAFFAPVIIGGSDAPGVAGGRGVESLSEAQRLIDVEVSRAGADTLVTGYVRRAPWPDGATAPGAGVVAAPGGAVAPSG